MDAAGSAWLLFLDAFLPRDNAAGLQGFLFPRLLLLCSHVFNYSSSSFFPCFRGLVVLFSTGVQNI